METPAASPFVRGVAGILVLQGAILVVSVAAGAVVARALGPAGKGLLTLALLVPMTAETLLNGGLGLAYAYYAGAGRMRIRELSANALFFALVVGFGGLLLIAVLLLTRALDVILPGLSREAVAVASAAFPFLLLNRYLAGIAQGFGKLRTVYAVKLAEMCVVLGLLLVLVVWSGGGPFSAIVAYVGGTLVATVLLMGVMRTLGGDLRPRWDRPLARASLSFGLRGHAGNILQYMNYRLDMFFVVYFLGPAALGLYSVSVRLAELLWHLPDAVGFAILPKAAGARAGEMDRFTARAATATVGLTLAAAGGLALVGRPLIQLVYSDAFTAAFLPMLALLPGVVLLGGAKVITNDIAGRGYPHYNSINAGIGLLATVVLDLLLIPRFGILGAALGSSFAYALVLGIAVAFFRHLAGTGTHGGPGHPDALGMSPPASR